MQVPASERLSYRMLNSSEHDAQLLFDLDQDPEVMRFMSDGKPSSMQDIREIFIPRLECYRNPEKGWGLWACFDNDSAEFLGWVLTRPMHFFSDAPEYDNIELGWRFKRKSWGKGLATEAAISLQRALHKQFGITRFTAIADEHNHASIAVMKKLGMHYQKKAMHKDPLGDMELVYYTQDSFNNI